MKIFLVINSSENGGANKMIVSLFQGIREIHPESKLIFLRKADSQYDSIDGAEYLSNELSSLVQYGNVYYKLFKLVKKEKPGAMISFLPLANIYSSTIGRFLGVKNRIVSQRNPPHIYGNVVRRLDKFLGSNGFYTSNVCNAESVMEAFSSGYSKSYKERLTVIHNSVEPADMSLSKIEARKILKIREDEVVVTCVGRLHEQKNHSVLVKSAKRIENGVFYFAGDGALRGNIESQIKEEGVGDRVVLLGDLTREQVRLLLRASDLFVIPSLYEGLSNSLIEALSYGLPVIFNNIPSFTSFLKVPQLTDEYAGYLITSDTEWAKAIDELVNDESRRLLLSKRALEKVSDLTTDRMALKFAELIKR